MSEQLAFSLTERPGDDTRFNVDDMRLMIMMASPRRVCSLAAGARRRRSAPYRKTLAALVEQRARKMKDSRARRRLFWALGELYAGLDQLWKAADFYARGAEDLEGQADGLALACVRARILCLARLGCRTEAAAECNRFHTLATQYPSLVTARLERDVAERLVSLGLVEESLAGYKISSIFFRKVRRPRCAALSLLAWAQAEMMVAPTQDTRAKLEAGRDLFEMLDDERGVARCDLLQSELSRQQGMHEEQLLVARRAFHVFAHYGDPDLAAAALGNCADAAARLGDTRERDRLYLQTFKLLVAAAADDRDDVARWLVRLQAAELRLEYVDYLVSDDDSYSEAIDQAERAVRDLRSFKDLGARQLTRALDAIGRARQALEGSVRRVCEPGSSDSPVSMGLRLLPIDSPALLIHLGVCMDPN